MFSGSVHGGGRCPSLYSLEGGRKREERREKGGASLYEPQVDEHITLLQARREGRK